MNGIIVATTIVDIPATIRLCLVCPWIAWTLERDDLIVMSTSTLTLVAIMIFDQIIVIVFVVITTFSLHS